MRPRELSQVRLDSDRAASSNSRVSQIDKSYETRRAQCEADMITMLTNIGGTAGLPEMLGVFHLHYAPKRNKRRGRSVYMRPETLSDFLRRMENAGLVVCKYDGLGVVIEARIR